MNREFKALTEQPEKLCVGDLIQAVKDLREFLYQEKLKKQELQKCLDAQAFEALTDRLS